MNKIIALGTLALALMFAVNASAKDFKDGVTAVEIQHKSQPHDPEIHLLVKRAKDKNGDGIFTIQKSKDDKRSLSWADGKIDWGAPTKWILHENSNGWSILLESDGAMALSIVENALTLQRNQGSAHQIWEIKEVK